MTAGAASPEAERFRRVFLLLLLAAISLAFLTTVRALLMPLLLAAIFSGVCWPLQTRITAGLRGRRNAASLVTLLLLLCLVVVPLLVFMGIVAAQALEVSEAVKPWLSERVADQAAGKGLLTRVKLPGFLQPWEPQILAKLGQLAERAGSFLVQELAAATRGTVTFFFLLFVMLYSMFFFLRDGDALLARIVAYLPLSPEERARLLGRFVSVTRAMLRGTLVIAILQGALAGVAFAVVGIRGAAFWGTLMAVLSLIPGVGTALVWIPAVVYLYANGARVAAVGLAVWCALVVGTVDNLLRPRLVGHDTRMSDLLVFLSTLGGLAAFGAPGILVGPLIAALFVTVWNLYGIAFRDVLPPTAAEATAAEPEDG